MGRPDVAKPVDGPEFALFVKMMREHPNIWSKVSCPERLSRERPQGAERRAACLPRRGAVCPHLVETFPDRVLWGTDWPHPNLKDHMPDDGLLVDFIPQIATTAGAAAQVAGRQPDPLVLDRGSAMSLDKPYLDVPGTTIFDAEQSRKGYHLNQFCMSLMKADNRDALQGRRTRLPGRMADDRGAEAGRAGA